MACIYESKEGILFLIYEKNSDLFLRKISDDSFNRPIVLTTDYKSSFQSTIYAQSIYYLYVNQTSQLVIKSTKNQQILYLIDDFSSEKVFKPSLITFQNKLILLYAIYDFSNKQYILKGCFPFRPDITFSPDLGFRVDDRLTITHTDSFLYLVLTKTNNSKEVASSIFRYDSNFELTKFGDLENYENMLSSATEQYNELMEVAKQYRNESIKWRKKFGPD